MPVSDTTPYIQHTGNGVTTLFTFPFKVLQLSDLKVYLAGSLQLSGFIVTGIGSDTGGDITFTTAPANGATVLIERVVDYSRTTDYQTNGAFREQTVDFDQDMQTMQIQQVAAESERALKIDRDMVGVDTELPIPTSSSLLIGWDPSLTSFKNYDSSTLGGLVVAGTSYTDVFTPTVSQTTFTLTAAPGSVHALDVVKYGTPQINGVDFTVSGNTLTMTVAPGTPPGSAKLVARYSAAIPVASVDSQNATFTPTTAYTAGSIGAAMQDNMVNVMWFLTEAERAQVKSGGTTIDLTSKIAAAKSYAGNRLLYFPKGTYSFTSFDGKGWYGGLVGDGMLNTILKVRSSVTRAIDFNETSDVIISPFLIKDMTIDGNSLATTLIDIRYRHHPVIENVLLAGATTQLLNTKDTWLNTFRNCRFQAGSGSIGAYLRGSNHRTAFYGCTFTASTVWQIKVESLGTAADGNEALYFANCDVEFAGTAGGGVYFDGTSAVFDCCYIGEGINSNVIEMRGGSVLVDGGVYFFGYTTSTFGCNAVAGKLLIRKARVNAQSAGSSIQYLVTAANTLNLNVLKLQDCAINAGVGGAPIFPGDPLDYGSQAYIHAPRTGRVFSSAGNNVTVSNSTTNNELKATATAAPGPSPLISVYASTKVPSEWRAGESAFLVMVYASTKAVNVYLSNAAFGGAALIVSLPSTSGEIKTAIKLDYTLPTTAYTVIEAILQSVAVNDYLTIYELFLADSRMLNKGSSNAGNIYKC